LAVAEHSAERGVRFENPAIQPANPDSNRRPFKHRLEAQIASIVVHRRKLTNDIHADTAPLHFQVSGKQNPETCATSLRFQTGKKQTQFFRE
jgi:hypothetical protein